MKSKKRAKFLAFFLAPAFICSDNLRERMPDNIGRMIQLAKPGRPTKPRPTVSGAQPTFFEAMKTPTCSEK